MDGGPKLANDEEWYWICRSPLAGSNGMSVKLENI
jgi:hypothetical protein